METTTRDNAPSIPPQMFGDQLTKLIIQYAIWGLILVVVILFSFGSPAFLTGETLRNILVQATISVIVASGLTLVIAAGNWDLSFGSVAGLAGMMASWVMGQTLLEAGGDGNLLPALAVGLGIGLLCGALNGVLIAYLGFNDLLTTLATSAVFLGLTWIPSDGYKIYKGLGDGYRYLYSGKVGEFPFVIILTVVIVGLIYLLLHRAAAGRRIYATGGNATAARYSGVRIPRIRFLVFALAGVLAAVGGILTTSQQVGAWVLLGQPFLQRDFAAVFLGWALVGKPSILGTVIGAIFLATLRIGLILVDVPYHYSDVTVGVVLLAAIAIGSERQKRI